MTSIQDRRAFKSFQAIIQDLYNGERKHDFCAKGYIWDDEDDGTLVMNTYAGGKTLDWIFIHSCISLHMNPTPERVTADTQ